MAARGANTFPLRNRLPYPFSLVVRPLFCFVVCWHSLPFQDKYVSGDSVNFRGSDNYYPDLVREFYHNLRIVTDEFDDFTLLSKVSNKDICLNVEEFRRVLGIPSQGLVLLRGNIPEDWQPYSKIDVFVDMCRPTQRDTVRQQLANKFNMFGSS